ncbi:MAG: hypothetical protein JO131_09330 [Gammaproteobacteria bacterium]|nr:hypothetical protein [Gammaproteobacteria bacterium]
MFRKDSDQNNDGHYHILINSEYENKHEKNTQQKKRDLTVLPNNIFTHAIAPNLEIHEIKQLCFTNKEFSKKQRNYIGKNFIIDNSYLDTWRQINNTERNLVQAYKRDLCAKWALCIGIPSGAGAMIYGFWNCIVLSKKESDLSAVLLNQYYNTTAYGNINNETGYFPCSDYVINSFNLQFDGNKCPTTFNNFSECIPRDCLNINAIPSECISIVEQINGLHCSPSSDFMFTLGMFSLALEILMICAASRPFTKKPKVISDLKLSDDVITVYNKLPILEHKLSSEEFSKEKIGIVKSNLSLFTIKRPDKTEVKKQEANREQERRQSKCCLIM